MIRPNYKTPRDITQEEVRAICTIKDQSWPHSMESQLEWWKKYTAKNDVFVTLVNSGSILAFLRLRNRTVSVRGVCLGALCVTEVCVNERYQGQGLGMQLLDAAAAYVKKTNSSVAYLLCWDIQEPFYAACGWHRTDASPQIESASGQESRPLAKNERCMIFDPQNRLNGRIVLFGDVF